MVFDWMGKQKGTDGDNFSQAPSSYGTTVPRGPAEAPLRVKPKRGLALIHFPATAPWSGGFVDFNVTYNEEKTVGEDKYVVNQFVYSDKYRLSDTSCDYPRARLSDETF